MKNILDVTQNNYGSLYKAYLNGERIYENELFDNVFKTQKSGLTLEHYVNKFEQNNPDFKVIFSEIDVD